MRLPAATLRAWVLGRSYPLQAGAGFFEPLIRPPGPAGEGRVVFLSFSNLIEAHVLRALRQQHRVSVNSVRSAIEYADVNADANVYQTHRFENRLHELPVRGQRSGWSTSSLHPMRPAAKPCSPKKKHGKKGKREEGKSSREEEARLLRWTISNRWVSYTFRSALTAEARLGIERVLLSPELRTLGGELFIDRYGALINLSRSGQLTLKHLFRNHLERVEWGEFARPVRLFPFVEDGSESRNIVLDPRLAFGKPVIAGHGVSTAVIVERFEAGENGIRVEVHQDHLRHDTPDVEWLTEIGQRGWFAISHNARIQYTPLEHRAVVMAGVGLFIVVGKSTSVEWAERFVRAYGAVQGFIARHRRPFIARVYQDGRVLRFYPDRERF